jgi:3-hydroxyacyl-[acyl-carrier-protein] dehydratase
MIEVSGLKSILPHRHPVLLVDRVTELVAGRSLTALKAVSTNEPWYAGLADDAPPAAYAYPRTLLIESWCQAAGVLATADRPNPDVLTGDVMLFGSLNAVSFGAPVFPGSLVEHHIRVVRVLSDTMVFEGESVAGGERVLTVGQVMMALRPAGVLRREPLSDGEARLPEAERSPV